MGSQDKKRPIPRGAKPAKAKPPVARKSLKNEASGALKKRLAGALKSEAEALERETATSEILRVISGSPTDVQPVFESVVSNVARLCGATDVALAIVDGDAHRIMAWVGPFFQEWRPDERRLPTTRGAVAGRAILDRTTVHVHDLAVVPEEEYPIGRALQRRFGHHTMLAVPLLRDGVPLGVIAVVRTEVRPFTERQIGLIKTFADQAVIAIENVRLFNETKEALEQQTATSEILSVISSSPTDSQPVFESIARSVMRLCEGSFSVVSRYDGELVHLVAHAHITAEGVEIIRRMFPMRPSREGVHGRVVLDGGVVHIPDVTADPDYSPALGQALRLRSALAVPMLRDGRVIGAVAVGRVEVRPFSDKEIALLQTFADQAVIAIENVRLFTELQSRTSELARSVREMQALAEVSRAVSSTLDLEIVLNTIVARAVELSAAYGGVIYEYDDVMQQLHVVRGAYRLDEDVAEVIRAAPLGLGEGVAGKAAALRVPVQVADILDKETYDVGRIRSLFQRHGYRSVLGVPLLLEHRILGVLVVWRQEAGSFTPEVVSLLQTFANQSVLAVENARLFREIEDKSRQLEAASRHKSEFLANMSHELRTPLNAIIGFSEVLSERMFGELNEKQEEYLKDIYASGQHLLSLINDILDLSKIEAGRMELELTDFDLPQAISNALTLVRERAARRGIALHQAVDQRLGQIRGDERKIKQVLLNILSNALKFTSEGGRVEVRASLIDGRAEISVTDTGVGIAPEDQEAVFEEFRQVGTTDKKVEGTGLGLTLSRKFIELHGGRIWVKSQMGVGSTFTFTLPLTS
jgi:signal transduction histidine kinase